MHLRALVLLLTFAAPSAAAKGNKTIYLQPFAGVSAKDLVVVRTSITTAYGYHTKTLRHLPVPSHRDCNQRWCDAGHLFNTLYGKAPRRGIAVVGVTAASLSSGFRAQGVARRYGHHCLVSTHGLPKAYQQRRRLISQITVHELGHVFGGTGHCDLVACVMAPYLSNKSVAFCRRCKRRIRARGYAVIKGQFLPRPQPRRRYRSPKAPSKSTRKFLQLLASCGVDCQLRNLHRRPQVRSWNLRRTQLKPIKPLPAVLPR